MARRSLPVFFLLACVLSAFQCSNPVENKDGQHFPEGKYYYSGYDSSGTPVSQGWFSVAYTDSANFTGTWQIDKLIENANIGPQSGSGELIGTIDSDNVYIGLNPNMADNNVSLYGTYRIPGGLNGEWTYTGFPGIINKGTFSAYRSDGESN